jgi:hypothetical protein
VGQFRFWTLRALRTWTASRILLPLERGGFVKLPLVEGKDEIPHQFTGTFIRLEVEKPKGKNFEGFIQQIIEKGEREAATSAFLRRASKSTKSF